MNIKTAVVVFNVTISIIFISIFFMPLFIGDFGYLSAFWRKYWFAVIILPIFLVTFDILIGIHFRFITALTEEDWPEVASYLESKIFKDNRFYTIYLSLFIQSSVVCGNFSSVRDLHKLLQQKRPQLIVKNVLKIGSSYLLERDFASAVSLFCSCSTEKTLSHTATAYVRFYYGFSLYVTGKIKESADVLASCVACSGADIVILAFCGFILDQKVCPLIFNGREPLKAKSLEIRQHIRKKIREHDWEKMIIPLKKELYIAALGTIPSDAGRWIFNATF